MILNIVYEKGESTVRHSRFNIALFTACSFFAVMLSATSPAFAAYPPLPAAGGKPAIAAHRVSFESGTVQLALQVLAPGKTIEAVRIDNMGGISSFWRSDGREGAAPLSVSQGGAPLSLGSMPMIFNPGNTEALLLLSLRDNGAFAGKATDFRVTVFFTGGDRAMYALSAGDFPAAPPVQAVQAAPASATPTAQTAALGQSLLMPLIIIISAIILISLIFGAIFLIKKQLLAKSAAGLLAKAADGEVGSDLGKAMDFFKKSAAQEHLEPKPEVEESKIELSDAESKYEFATKLFNGSGGVKKDEAKAFNLLSEAAESGHVMAQEELGLRYLKGNGIQKDPSQAVRWLEKAAEQGSAAAQYRLALCLQAGEGIEKNNSLAAAWFEEAASQNYTDTQYKLDKR